MYVFWYLEDIFIKQRYLHIKIHYIIWQYGRILHISEDISQDSLKLNSKSPWKYAFGPKKERRPSSSPIHFFRANMVKLRGVWEKNNMQTKVRMEYKDQDLKIAYICWFLFWSVWFIVHLEFKARIVGICFSKKNNQPILNQITFGILKSLVLHSIMPFLTNISARLPSRPSLWKYFSIIGCLYAYL